MTSPVTDNTAQSRFELDVDGHTAFAAYRVAGDILFVDHVEAPLPLRGTGAAGHLMEGVAAIARERGLKIRPVCGYAAAWLQRRTVHHDLLA